MTARLTMALALVALAACKTRGTIAIDVVYPEPACPEVMHAIVYAEPNLRCVDCQLCGACFGASEDAVNGCPDDADGLCEPSLSDVELDLAPGHWMVMVALLADTDDPDVPGLREVGAGCVEIDVAADGTETPPATDLMIACETDCDPLTP